MRTPGRTTTDTGGENLKDGPLLFFGQIVGAYISDDHGHINGRSAVIIDDDNDYERSGKILFVPVTRRPQRSCPYYHIQVHYGIIKDPYTGLYYPCWAKCNWASLIKIKRINSSLGHMPDDLLGRLWTYMTLSM